MSPRFVLGRENVPCVAEVVNRSLKADCTDFTCISLYPCYRDAYMNTCISLIMHSYILSILLTNMLVTKIPAHAYV